MLEVAPFMNDRFPLDAAAADCEWPGADRPFWSAQRQQADVGHGSVDGGNRPIADIASKSVFDRKAVIGATSASVGWRYNALSRSRYAMARGVGQRPTVPNSLALGIEWPVRSFGAQISMP